MCPRWKGREDIKCYGSKTDTVCLPVHHKAQICSSHAAAGEAAVWRSARQDSANQEHAGWQEPFQSIHPTVSTADTTIVGATCSICVCVCVQYTPSLYLGVLVFMFVGFFCVFSSSLKGLRCVVTAVGSYQLVHMYCGAISLTAPLVSWLDSKDVCLDGGMLVDW